MIFLRPIVLLDKINLSLPNKIIIYIEIFEVRW